MGSQLPLLETESLGGYVPRAQNLLQHIFIQHFPAFVDSYDERYAEQYGKFGLERIEEVARHFIIRGDYSHGIARIRCTDPECGHDFLSPVQYGDRVQSVLSRAHSRRRFDQAARFVSIPLSDLAPMTQYLRRRVVKFFRQKE